MSDELPNLQPDHARPTAGTLHGIVGKLDNIDRRWIYLAMALAIAIPILYVSIYGANLPQAPTAAVQGAFDTIEKLPENSKILVFFDYDPASAGELQPMATSVLHHCQLRGHRIYCAALWPAGAPLIGSTLAKVIGSDPRYIYGQNYVNLGYQAGNEGVMKQANTNFMMAFPLDSAGTPCTQIPMMNGITAIGEFDAMVSISAGYPGAKEWIQYSISPTLSNAKPLKFVAGTTGVQTPQLIPYYPVQMAGILGAIKGAAEYEALVNGSAKIAAPDQPINPQYEEAQRRMAPQLVAHLLMVFLIIAGNAIYFITRSARAAGVGA